MSCKIPSSLHRAQRTIKSVVINSTLNMKVIVALILLFANANAFFHSIPRINRGSELYMGRAAAVRANTKAKTDAAKAKNNGRYAKKIIAAVKYYMLFAFK